MVHFFNVVKSTCLTSTLVASPSTTKASIQPSFRFYSTRNRVTHFDHLNPKNKIQGNKDKNADKDYQLEMEKRENLREREKSKRKAAYFRNAKAPLFVDSLLLLLRAGSGGDGCSSFARAKYIPYGPPSGGHGGKGGDIYIKAVTGLTSLSKLGSGGISSSGSGGSSNSKGEISSNDTTSGTIKAGIGAHGTGSFRDGKKGKDRILEVPVGTICKIFRDKIWDWSEEEFESQRSRNEYENSLVERIGRKKIKNEEINPNSIQDEQGKERFDGEEEVVVVEEEIYQSEFERKVQLEEDEIQDEEAASLRYQRDLVWRHYPRGGPSAEEQEAEDSYRRVEFEIAEERLGLAMKRERREKWSDIKELKKERKKLKLETRRKEENETEMEKRDRLGGFRFGGEIEQSELGDEVEIVTEVLSEAEDQEQDENEADLVAEEEKEEEDLPLFTIDFSTPTPPDSPGHLIASGGTGGYGNPYFLTSQNRSPKFATRGQRGETRRIRLELKVPADVGLVGMPNVGKSSLLQALTGAGDASAKVGDWNFTTLNPNVGVVRLDQDEKLMGAGQGRIGGREERELEREKRNSTNSISEFKDHSIENENQTESHRLTLLDLPGLLKDASKDVGLGHSFLRHAERCPLLVYVVDISTKVPEPWKDVEVLKNELEAYKPGLSKRAKLVVANKADALGPPVGLEAQYEKSREKNEDRELESQVEVERLNEKEARQKLETLRVKVREMEGMDLVVLPVSAMWRLGVEGLARKLKDLVKTQERQA